MAQRLDRERIVRRALDLLDEAGLDGLTVRRLASDLGVQDAALYWHVPSKAALLDEMAPRCCVTSSSRPTRSSPRSRGSHGRSPCGSRPSGSAPRCWPGATAPGCSAAGYLADERLAGWIDLPLSILVGAGFTVPEATRSWGTLLAFVQGFAVEGGGHAGGCGR